MKIVHVTHGYPPELIGGTELYVARLAAAQRAAGHEVRVFTGSVDWRDAFTVAEYDQDGIPVTRVHRNDLYFDRWDKGFNPLVAERFAEFLRAARPDLAHVHHWIRLTTNLVAIAARLGIPAVITAHDLYPSCPRVFRLKGPQEDDACAEPMGREACLNCVPRWRFQGDTEVGEYLESYRRDMRSELALARAVVAPSRHHGEFLARMLGRGPSDVVVVPHGSLAAGPDRSPTRGADGKIHLAYFSHLHPLKGAHVLLAGVAASAARARFVVHLYGEAADVEYEARLKELAAGLAVEFHGRYRPRELAAATIDLAVIPTLCRESYSFILDEAVLLGVPILAANAGALAERATGRVALFERNDPADLAGKLDAIAADPARLDAMRAADPPALATFAEHAPQIEAVYQRVLKGGPPEAPRDDCPPRLKEQWERRETLFRELVRIETWEDVVADLRGRIAELEEELRRRG